MSRRNQRGMASIVIVAVLATLLTLISIGFARLMDRSIQDSLNKEISSTAAYAAQSGINDAIKYLRANPGTAVSDCNTLTGSGGALGGDKASLSGTGSVTKYSCILIDPTPMDLKYKDIGASNSQVVQVKTVGVPEKLMFSWQTNSTNTSLPNSSLAGLLDETAWDSANYEPILRLTLYPVPANGLIDRVQGLSHTVFLYPTSGGSAYTTLHYSALTDGSLVPVYCNSSNPDPAVFKTIGSAYTCNFLLDSFASMNGYDVVGADNDYFYARLTPIYSAANIRIQANDSSGNLLKFIGSQANIDVTAKSGSASKRLQASVGLSALSGTTGVTIDSGQDTIPEYGLQSAKAICKRVDVNSGIASINDSFCANQIRLTPPPAPTVVTGSATVTATSATLTGKASGNGYAITGCGFSYGTDPNTNLRDQNSVGITPTPPHCGDTNSLQPVDATTITGLIPGTTYYYELCAINAGGLSCDNSQHLTFTTSAPQAPTVVTGGFTNVTGTSATLSGQANGNGYAITGCGFSYGTDPSIDLRSQNSSGITPTPPHCGDTNSLQPVDGTTITGLSPNTTYYYELCAINAGGLSCDHSQQFKFTTNTQQGPPSVSLQVSSTTIENGGTVTLSWQISGADFGCNLDQSTIGWSGPNGNSNASTASPALSGPGDYTFRINCFNAAGPGASQVMVHVNSPGGGGGGSALGFNFNSAKPNENAFVYGVQNVGWCRITDNQGPNGQDSGIFETPPSGTGLTYSFGSGDATIADLTCYADGWGITVIDHLTDNRGSGVVGREGCGYPAFDGWDIMPCAGPQYTHTHCGVYECKKCTNVNGTDAGVDCQIWGTGGCTDQGGTYDWGTGICTIDGGSGSGESGDGGSGGGTGGTGGSGGGPDCWYYDSSSGDTYVAYSGQCSQSDLDSNSGYFNYP